MSHAPGHRSGRAALTAAPILLLVTAAWMRWAHGPAWLAFNFDPAYAYLLNSVTMLEGYPPFNIYHPGVPLHALGSVVIVTMHAASGTATLAADVVGRPETYIFWIHAIAIVTTAALVAAAGAVTWTRAGLAAALLVQSGPWLSTSAASLLGQLRPEVLIAGTSTLWSALFVAHLGPMAGSASAVGLGILTGVTVSLHVSALPLVVGPLLLLETWTERRRFAVSTGIAFFVAFSPAWQKLPSFAMHMLRVAGHAGSYGTGSATILDTNTYFPAFWQLIAAEPIPAALVAGSAIVWGAWMRVRRTDGDWRARRCLGALVATQLFALVLTAKHPDSHYLVPAYCTLGANLWLAGRFIRARTESMRVPVAAAAGVALLAGGAFLLVAEGRRLVAVRAEQYGAARMVDAIVADERCFLVTAYRSSSEVEALQWGNLTSQYRGRPLFGVPIAQRFPRTAFDEGGLVVRDADWQLINLDALFGRERCVLYTGEVSNRPSSLRVVVETVGRSGSEGVYRLRPVQ